MKAKVLFSVLAVMLTMTACGAQMSDDDTSQMGNSGSDMEEAMAEVQKITADEAYEMMQGDEEVVIVDVRTKEEYEEKHIPGALLIPNEEITETPPAELPVMDAKILIYCRSGNRSAQAAEKLSKMGYTNIYDFGGINDWTYETEEGPSAADMKTGTGSFASFTAPDLNGAQKDESIFANHELTMVNIWATFCGPCLNEMPELGDISNEYADKGVQVVGIVLDVPKSADGTFDQRMVEKARSLADQTGANYLHLLPSDSLNNAKLKGVMSVPETVFIDAAGNQVGDSYVGARSGDDWKQIIESLL